jgi:hypothetical protein
MAFNAAKAKQIVAVEVDPFLVGLLQQSVVLSGVPVKILAAAAFSHVSIAEFSIAKRARLELPDIRRWEKPDGWSA